MAKSKPNTLNAWRSIVPSVQALAEGLTDAELDQRPRSAPMTVRETVHHVVEAQVVAASIVVAALGSPGCVYDWSWMMPFGEWMQRMRYDRKPVAPALRLMESLNAWVAAQVEPLPDGLRRTVRLCDAPGAEPRTVTVADVLQQEVDHVRHECRPFVAQRRRGAGGGRAARGGKRRAVGKKAAARRSRQPARGKPG